MPDPAIVSALLWPAMALLAAAMPLTRLAVRRRWPTMVGGLIAGLILGPAVLGRLAPDWERSLFIGGVAQQRALDDAAHRFEQDVRTLKATGVTPVAIAERRRDEEIRRTAMMARRTEAEWIYQRPLLLTVLMVVAPLALISAAMRWVGPRQWQPAVMGRGVMGVFILLVALALAAGLGWWAVGAVCLLGGAAMGGRVSEPEGQALHRLTRTWMEPLLWAYIVVVLLMRWG